LKRHGQGGDRRDASSLGFARDFGWRLERRQSASTSTPPRIPVPSQAQDPGHSESLRMGQGGGG
jgi:hypothetical protein